MEQVYLGIDIGAESGRLMAGLWDGTRMRLEELHRFPNGAREVNGGLRWDITRLWEEIQNGLRLAAQRYGPRIVSVGVDTWALDYVLMSAAGELLEEPFCYRDPRTRGLVEASFQRVPRSEIFAETGLQFMEINTLYQWIAHHRADPAVFQATDCFLMIPDWLNWKLSGVKAAEFTNATTTQFLNPVTRKWSVGLLERFGLPTHLLPILVEPGTRLGLLQPEVAQRTGLAQIPVIAPATHDTGSAVVGVPAQKSSRPDWAYISSGTWSLVGIETTAPLINPLALELNITNEGGVDGTWRVLKNVMGLWLVQQCRKSFAANGGTNDYAALMTLAAAAEPLRSLVNPDAPEFLNPPDMPAALREQCRRVGQPIPETEGALVRCALESLALKYAVVLDQLERLSGVRIEVIYIVGGGARNTLLNQMTADACQRRVVAGPTEATVLGNLLVQARAMGELGSLAEIREVVRQSSELVEYLPDASSAEKWSAASARFAKLI